MNVLNLLLHFFAEPISTLMLEKLYQKPTDVSPESTPALAPSCPFQTTAQCRYVCSRQFSSPITLRQLWHGGLALSTLMAVRCGLDREWPVSMVWMLCSVTDVSEHPSWDLGRVLSRQRQRMEAKYVW